MPPLAQWLWSLVVKWLVNKSTTGPVFEFWFSHSWLPLAVILVKK